MVLTKKVVSPLSFSLILWVLAIQNMPTLGNQPQHHIQPLSCRPIELSQNPSFDRPAYLPDNQMPVLDISSTPFQPSSKLLKGRYNGAEIRITNRSPHNLNLLNIQLTNGFTGNEAYKASHRGLVSWYSFLGVSSFVSNATYREIENKTGYTESERYVSFQPNTGILPDQTIQTVVLVQKKKPLIVTVHFQDSVTGKRYKTVYQSQPFA